MEEIITDTSDSDYEPTEEESEEESVVKTTSKKDIEKIKEIQLKKLKEIGELKTENIIEIQILERLIHESSMDTQQKIQTGKCLELLINCTNAYINAFADSSRKKILTEKVTEDG